MIRHEQLKDTLAMPVVGKPPSVVNITWGGERRFEAGTSVGGPTIHIDGNRKTGPSPVDVLLCALGTCTSIDVIDILTKRRTPVDSLSVQVIGERAAAVPSRVSKCTIAFTMKGAGIEREQAERAIDLSISKYCSVRDSLDPNIPVVWTLELNGASA